jgi:signal transduction histidine kinase
LQPTRRSWLVYGLLIAIWGAILGWQVAEHTRVRKSARVGLMNRAKDISDTLGLVMRSQRRFGGVISKERLESTLHELVKPGQLSSIALLNAAGEVVASAGDPIDLPRGLRSGEQWHARKVTLVNLVDLGTNVLTDIPSTNLTIVLPRRERPPGETNRPPPEMRDRPPWAETNRTSALNPGVPGPEQGDRPPPPPDGRERPRNWRDGRAFGRPPWMSEEEFKNLIVKQGVHGFVLVMSTAPLRAICNQDLWMRSMIGLLASISVIGSGLAWRNLTKSSQLQIRLIRASELNTHLREMNLAAAGLAHETRNPLNIIRGLAQLISKQNETPEEVRKKSREIVNEADRVTVQLNEFINYSRPREVRPAPVAISAVIAEVVRALSYDIEEKNVSVTQPRREIGGDLVIEADEQLLRQALFNLVLNAVQAVEPNGTVDLRVSRRNGSASLDVSDNGPGVPLEHRAQIFKPYVTMTQSGTGLGLAVVQQIVSAHGWEIQCLPNEPKGAIFRITHLKVAAKS